MEDARLIDGRTAEELAEVQRIHNVVLEALDQDIWQLAQFMVTRRDDQLLGETEFTLREKALRMGGQALQATERIDGGTNRRGCRAARLRTGPRRKSEGADLRLGMAARRLRTTLRVTSVWTPRACANKVLAVRTLRVGWLMWE